MKPRRLWRVSVTVAAEAEEAVAALLERLFGQSAAIYSSADAPTSLITVYSDQTTVASKREALEAGLKFVADCGIQTGPAQISIGKIPAEDWAESWKKYFKTIEIGNALLIKPSWSKQRPAKNQAVVVLDPGLSFGTGQHPTTHFCLEELVQFRNPKEQQAFLDIGTGSGILAISAAKLGYHPVKAFDRDPLAIRVAKANAKRNKVQISFSRQDLSRLELKGRTQFDIVCANLIDDLLIKESQRIINRVRPNGRLVLSGILASQFPAVEKVYTAAGLTLVRTHTEQEWQSGSFTVPPR